jgi:NitT/TauT family transport system ATP-binding protein
MKNKVVVQDYSLSFDGKNNVLEGISFDVSDGEFISLVGPSGCGKTTLLNLLAGLAPLIGSGSIKINERDPEIGSRDVAYMLARDSLFPWRTALGNAEFGMEARGETKEFFKAKALNMLAEVGGQAGLVRAEAALVQREAVLVQNAHHVRLDEIFAA